MCLILLYEISQIQCRKSTVKKRSFILSMLVNNLFVSLASKIPPEYMKVGWLNLTAFLRLTYANQR